MLDLAAEADERSDDRSAQFVAFGIAIHPEDLLKALFVAGTQIVDLFFEIRIGALRNTGHRHFRFMIQFVGQLLDRCGLGDGQHLLKKLLVAQ